MGNNKIIKNPIFDNKKNEEAELKDGKKVWLSRSPCIKVVVLAVNKSSIFVIAEKRSKTVVDGPGLWVIPSGYLDWDETGWEAAVRELYEETGFYVPKYKSNLIFNNDKEPWLIRTDPGENRQNVALIYCLIYKFPERLPIDVEQHKDEEIEEAKWIPIDQLSLDGRIWGFDHDIRIKMAVEKFKDYLI